MRQDSKTLIYLVVGFAVASVLFAAMALQIVPPEARAKAEVWEHYYHKGGMAKALLFFLSVATAISTIVGFAFMLLTVLRFDKGN